MTTLISLCMIVKNEERTLARCLESVQGLVDEIIIVDTGSTDTTKEIAKKYEAKLYDFTWVNDFSVARNESLQKATGKWILILDADEYMQKEEHTRLKESLLRADPSVPQGFIFNVLNIVGESESNMSGFLPSPSVRLISNSRDIYYSRPIHEQLITSAGHLACTSLDITVFHSGYTEDAKQDKGKSQRNLEIIAQSQTYINQPLDPYNNYTLGNEYFNLGDYKKAVSYYEQAYNQADAQVAWMPKCVDSLVSSYLLMGGFNHAFNYIQVGLQRWGTYSDHHAYLGFLYQNLGFNDLAKESFLMAIQLGEEASHSDKHGAIVKSNLANVFPSQKLVEIYGGQRDTIQTVHYLSKVLNHAPQDTASLHKLISILAQAESDSSIIAFLDRIYPIAKPGNLLLLFRMSLISAAASLAQYYYQKLKEINVQLGEHELLHFALLNQNQALFQQTVNKHRIATDPTSPPPYKFLLIGTLLWGAPEVPANSIAPEGNPLFRIGQSIHALIIGAAPAVIVEEDMSIYIDFLITLFNLHAFEAFDLLMNHLTGIEALNAIADYFFANNQLELSLNYYSILLEDHSLYASGYENLANLHLNQGEIEQGLLFLEQAVALNPNKAALYISFCRYSEDAAKKEFYKKSLLHKIPHLNDLPFIASM
ncbi:hypothetical protein Back11_52640 [Paenibacillus baekrokdamisoli]|uniref:Uncharacterized protein n=1 Tax=Paenibacillus baekrokdamisoli TaxID=1712516 RepID=A0A3G9JLK6_9BACL|nr:glycosyltransferase [Paenibacillus baekrokdamisoli]MBB3069105.1 glycosyltransferase involved in cell wall biosynthesis [Paenibacillus baekrokdamisoli]BBH23919.1 hypothetical protein Back11_52640 [Paenibacillus baekrokdamisoli]